jgi:hypothetical protein
MRHWMAFLALAVFALGCEKDKIVVVNNPKPDKDTVFVFETDTVFVHGDTSRTHWHHGGNSLARLAPNPMPNNHADENIGATLKGDVDKDGFVSFFDVALADSAVRGLVTLDAEAFANADINCDGALTYAEDVLGLLVYGAFIHGDNGFWCPFAEAVPCGLYTWPPPVNKTTADDK